MTVHVDSGRKGCLVESSRTRYTDVDIPVRDGIVLKGL